MNKRAVMWFEFLSKRFGPGPLSVELQVRWKRCKVCIRHERKMQQTKPDVWQENAFLMTKEH